jgi:hypothetical protein
MTTQEVVDAILSSARNIVGGLIAIVLWGGVAISLPYVSYRAIASLPIMGWEMAACVFAVGGVAGTWQSLTWPVPNRTVVSPAAI